MLALGLFLPLVLTASTVSWHNHEIRNICFALLLSWAVSNLTAITLPFDYRVLIYPVLEVIVGLMAGGAWLVMRFTPGDSRSSEGQLVCIAIVVVTLISVACVVNYAGTITSGQGDRYLFVLSTNICFAVECILAGAWGVRDALHRAVGIARLFHSAGPPVGANASAVEGHGAEG